jgi:transposase
VIGALNTQIDALEARLADRFEAHPDAAIVCSLPGLGTILGARVLGEFGDDPDRYIDARARKNYAGTSPITRAAGKTHGQALRALSNRLVGILHGCLASRAAYDEAIAWRRYAELATAA